MRICEGSCIDGPDGYGWTCADVANVGYGSCIGHNSCRFVGRNSIGDASCIGEYACRDRTTEGATVGDGSCTVNNGCRDGTGAVGDCVESCSETCPNSDILVWDESTQQCISDSSSPSISPSLSPSGVPSMPPSLSPSSTPSSNPSARVMMDVKTSCVKIDGNGVIPVAIYGDANLDVHSIDVSTLSLNGLSVKLRGDGYQCSVEDENADGYDDLKCQFVDDADNWQLPEDETIVLTGTVNGDKFIGYDEVCTSGSGGRRRMLRVGEAMNQV